mgnify:CR=1 FL=1
MKMINNNIVRWIMGIIVIVDIISILTPSFKLLDLASEMSELAEPYTQYYDESERIKNFLTEDGYEVIYAGISNYSANAPFFDWYNIEDNTVCPSEEKLCYSDKVGVSVEMKSLGNRNDQIWYTLTAMSSVYENAFTYGITIKSPQILVNMLFSEKGIEIGQKIMTLNQEWQFSIKYIVPNLVLHQTLMGFLVKEDL